MNERGSWRICAEFVGLVFIILLFMDKCGGAKEMHEAEERARVLMHEADSLRGRAMAYRMEADSLHREADRLRQRTDSIVTEVKEIDRWYEHERKNIPSADAARLKRIILWAN